MMGRRRGERGTALVVCLFLVLMTWLVLLSVTSRVVLSGQAQRARYDRTVAFNLAEAGLAEAVQRIVREESGTVGETQLGDGDYDVSAEAWEDESGRQVIELTATGRCRSRVETLVFRVWVDHDPRGEAAPRVTRGDWHREPGKLRS